MSFGEAEELMAHYRSREHQERMGGLEEEGEGEGVGPGIEGGSILNSIEGDLSSDIR